MRALAGISGRGPDLRFRTKFTTTSGGAFQVNDRLLINGDILALVTEVGDTSPYEITGSLWRGPGN